ncbi:uncharacterized protein ACHE_10935A [Aspergillus chevalieri]|uniref:Uncharacterized protein n=1 Tax=Aspergillus chevalieri TaxID=182096 RepID=A0A7R7VF30_ASPCH|nr:uncharacterized protein ACHE_10935A [Aspergillus chevalieri]BCR83533.1 hypothetical protein ACHE_10935A [Aspergillus chevalieri]
MDTTVSSRPPLSQRDDTEHPVEKCRNYLLKRGMTSADMDYLSSKYNQRCISIHDNAKFFDILKGLVETQDCAQITIDDFKVIEAGLQKINGELEAQFKACRTTILLNHLSYLDTHLAYLDIKKLRVVSQYAWDFIKSDAYINRINYIMEVLPELLKNLTPTPIHPHPAAEDQCTTQIPNSPKKRVRKPRAQRLNAEPRRSARIKRLQENSKEPKSPRPSRHKNSKGRQFRQKS